MFKKFFLVAAALFAFAAASFAADIAKIDLNYWCRGNLKLLNELPDGVKMSARKNYTQKKFSHICLYTVEVDLNKAQEFELELEVVDTGDKESADLRPSLCPLRGQVVECLEFEAGEEPSPKAPGKIAKWTQMQSISVMKGDKITVKGKFKKPAAK